MNRSEVETIESSISAKLWEAFSLTEVSSLRCCRRQGCLVIVSDEKRVGKGWESLSTSRKHPGYRISPAASCSLHALQAGQHSMQTAFPGLGSFQDQKLNPPEANGLTNHLILHDMTDRCFPVIPNCTNGTCFPPVRFPG